MTDKELYKDWLQFVFDRPETTPEWFWDITVDEFKATDEQKVMLIGETFLNSGRDLEKYTDSQVNNGLKYIFDVGISDTVSAITQKNVSEDLRIQAVLNMKHLYRECFAKRCTNTAFNSNHPDISPLNYICYMLWDTSPLGNWKSVVFDVMEDALYIPHDACVGSALHGLGHRVYKDPERAQEIIDRFLSKTKYLKPELKAYALEARTGQIL